VQLVERVRLHCSDVPLEVIDVDTPGVTVPKDVIGTPTYTWNNRVVFMGNPGEAALLEYVRLSYEYQHEPAPR
jgi:hypothetical protein